MFIGTCDSHSLKRGCELESWGNECTFVLCLFDLEQVPAQWSAFLVQNVLTMYMFE